MPKPRVFITHEPLKFDRSTGKMMRWADLSPAAEFGTMVFMLPPGPAPNDLQASLPQIQDKLKDFNADDFLMAVGNPALLACAAAIAARAANGKLQVLVWQTAVKRYGLIRADVWAN